jgi:hypothetical protein
VCSRASLVVAAAYSVERRAHLPVYSVAVTYYRGSVVALLQVYSRGPAAAVLEVYPQAFAAVVLVEYLRLAGVSKLLQEQEAAHPRDPRLLEAVELRRTCYLLPEEM